jgi:hypothetical protein
MSNIMVGVLLMGLGYFIGMMVACAVIWIGFKIGQSKNTEVVKPKKKKAYWQ